MARKRKQIEPEQYFDETGQLRFVSVETCEEMRNGEATQVEVRGFWSGEPHKSHFFALPEVPDKRGIRPSLKRRVGEEAESLAKIREALKHPITPDAKTAAKHRLASSERKPPFKRGTLKWYRNELALAQDRIHLIESERNALMAAYAELRDVVAKLIEAPVRAGSAGYHEAMPKLKANKERREKDIIDAAEKVLEEHLRLPRENLTPKVAKKTGYSEPTVRKVLQAEGYVAKKNTNTPS